MNATDKIIEKYLNFDGPRTTMDFMNFHFEVMREKEKHKFGSRELICLTYIEKKLMRGIEYAIRHNNKIDYVIIEDTIEDIERGYDLDHDLSGARAKKPRKKNKKKKGLGKIVDHGKSEHDGKSDEYWKREGMEIIFKPNDESIRVGKKIDSSYHYNDVRFLENYYGIRAFEFGNWLSQQDRENYLSGLGLALFDLHSAIGLAPTQIGLKGKLAVSLGARGRGKARAHFESDTFTINLTRYSRPPKENKRSVNFSRAKLMLVDGGVGSFAHEYGHALDFYGGMFIEKGSDLTLSGGLSTDFRVEPALLKKNTLRALMEKLMFKILWKTPKAHSDYATRLLKVAKTDYFKERQEIFARAFEVYVHYKLDKHKYKNIFLNKVKYNKAYYLTFAEMKRIEPEFDAVIKAIKKHI